MRKITSSVAAVCLVVGTTSAWGTGNDELWEMTTTMKMQGMAMQPMKSKFCQAKDGEYNPSADKPDKNCTVTDQKVTGNTVSWKMQCTGKNAMTGSGEMTRTADGMKGSFNMRAQGMDMVQVMEGKRVGTCDAAAQKKAINDAVAEADAANATNARIACDNAVQSAVQSGGRGNGDSQFKGKGACVAYKTQICDQIRTRVGTHAGFAGYVNNRDQAQSMNQSWGWAMTECGITLEQYRPTLCKSASNDKNYRFIGGFCPTEAADLNTRYCAGFGRGYTSDAQHPNASLCRAIRSKAASYQDADTKANAAADKAKADENAKEQEKANAKATGSMEKMKKMFGF